jgi:hypothetical protein
MNNDFHKIIKDKYGIMSGDGKLVFVKTGRGGSVYGYNNKYLNLAKSILTLYGYSVVISANPADSECYLNEELEEVKEYIGDYDEVYFIGVSAGALVGAQQGYMNEKISKMLLVNGPLMINWPKTKTGIEKFQGNRVEMLYGMRDPSYKYFEILNYINSDKLERDTVEDADHNFAGKEKILEQKIIDFINN